MAGNAQTELERLIASQPEWFPLELTARYREKRLEARIDASGNVLYGGAAYQSPSAAARAARRANGYIGSTGATTNGWQFWHFVDGDGQKWPLDALRHL